MENTSGLDVLNSQGGLYCNYWGFYSFVLLTWCDANYSFKLFDLGQYGSTTSSPAHLFAITGRLFFKIAPGMRVQTVLKICTNDLGQSVLVNKYLSMSQKLPSKFL